MGAGMQYKNFTSLMSDEQKTAYLKEIGVVDGSDEKAEATE